MKTIKVGQYVETSAGVGRVVRIRDKQADVYGPSLGGGGNEWRGHLTWAIWRKKSGHWGGSADKGFLLPAKKPRKGK